MSKPDPHLDVATLLDRSGLGSGGYRTFGAEEKVRRTPAVRSLSGERQKVAAPDSDPKALQAAPAVSESNPVQRGQISDVSVVDIAGRLLSRPPGKQGRKRAEPAWDALPLGHCLALTSVGGGAGATTILANAAAALAAFGERVTVADEAPSLLPFYFGGDSFRSGAVSFAPPRGSGSGPVHLVTGIADDSDNWLLHGLTEFREDSDRILVHCGTTLTDEAARWTSQAAAVVVLLTPDPSSLLRLAVVLERLRRSSEGEAHPLLLLNQFDAGSELHLNLRGELSRRFGEHLLPFVIERDEAFPHCLAAGGTVIELAPESRAAGGIRSLVDWLRNYRFEAES